MHPQYTTDDIARFWSKVDCSGECWLYTGGTNGVGYGYFGLRHNQPVTAHRFAYELTYGPIPEGMSCLHHCDNRRCCRPDHLFLGTHKDNTRDMLNKGREARGESHGSAKLTEDDVQRIRARYSVGGISMKRLGREFGVSAATICYIVNHKHWNHV